MTNFEGQALSWSVVEGVLEVALHRQPCNEIGTIMLGELEGLITAWSSLEPAVEAVIFYSSLPCGFSAGADLRELYERMQGLTPNERATGVRSFLERIHRVFNTLDQLPVPTIAAVHGVTFGGGWELALTCDLIIADKMTRFCFPELRLGLIPAFGGIPRLKRDVGNGLVRDILLTGRSINALKAQALGLVSQVVAPGQALPVARTVAHQMKKFDRTTRATAKRFIKFLPAEELKEEISLFCKLVQQPAFEEGLRTFIERRDVLPYLP